MDRSHDHDEYQFPDFSTGGADGPLPDVFQSVFSQDNELPLSDYDFKDYDTEPYVGTNDFEDINPYVHDDEYLDENTYDTEETFYDEDDFYDEDEFYEEDAVYDEDVSASDFDSYNDVGEYRTYDGNHEYRSFDTALPEVSPEGWYHYSDEDMELEGEEYAPELDAHINSHRKLKILANAFLAFFTALSLLYLIALYSNIGFISNLRSKYIKTAMNTLNHKWMATAIIPGDIIDEVMLQRYQADQNSVGVETKWGPVQLDPLPSFAATTTQTPAPTEATDLAAEPSPAVELSEEDTFFEIFEELDRDSMQGYLIDHPDALEDGWSKIDINESGLDEDGTDIRTIHGDQVLAVNAKDGVILIRLEFSTARGVLAICKDTSRINLCPAATLGTIGQTAGRICDASDGILAIAGSAFIDPKGAGNGGTLSGLMVCDGQTYGTPLGGTYKRLELRNDNKMYVVDSSSSVNENTRDASEFMPAVIVDGELIKDTGWDGFEPRTVLGQSSKLETMMVIVEGRLSDSIGCSVEDVAEVMKQYGCVQAMNLDGGTSAIMYYQGEYVTRCSNTGLPEGRTLPSAWVYHGAN